MLLFYNNRGTDEKSKEQTSQKSQEQGKSQKSQEQGKLIDHTKERIEQEATKEYAHNHLHHFFYFNFSSYKLVTFLQLKDHFFYFNFASYKLVTFLQLKDFVQLFKIAIKRSCIAI